MTRLYSLITIILAALAFVISELRFHIAMEQPSGLFVKGHSLTYALMLVLLLAIIIAIVLNANKNKDVALNTEEKIGTSSFVKVSAFIMLACSVLTAAVNLITAMNSAFLIQNFGMIILPIIAAFSFMPVAVMFSTGTWKLSTAGVALIPVFTSAIMLIMNYVSTTQMSTPAQYGFLIIAQLANILFFYYFAKFLKGAPCAPHLCAFSMFAAVANAATYLSQFVFDIASGTPTVSTFGNLFGIGACIYAISVLVFVSREIVKSRKKPLQINGETNA